MHASEFNVEKFVDIIEKENGTISEVYILWPVEALWLTFILHVTLLTENHPL